MVSGPGVIQMQDKRHYLALGLADEPREAAVDITVTRAADNPKAWTLTDLLGRPLGRITKHPSGSFIIEPSWGGLDLMANVNRGAHASLDEALSAIEKCTHGSCQRAPGEDEDQP